MCLQLSILHPSCRRVLTLGLRTKRNITAVKKESIVMGGK